jgi:hypothetical protein
LTEIKVGIGGEKVRAWLIVFFSVGSGYALAVNVNSQWNRIRGRRDDHSNRNWILEIDTLIPNGVVLMLIGIGIGIGIDNRC